MRSLRRYRTQAECFALDDEPDRALSVGEIRILAGRAVEERRRDLRSRILLAIRGEYLVKMFAASDRARLSREESSRKG